MRFAFSPKLRLAPIWPAAAALLVVGGLTLGLLPGVVAEVSAREEIAVARLVERGLALAVAPAGRADAALLQERVRSLAAATSYRLTVIALDGTVHADSDRTAVELATMDNHRTRPEVAAALARGEGVAVRHSDTTGVDTAYAAVLARAADGGRFLVRVGRPLAGLAALRAHLARTLLTSAAIAIVLVLLLSWWFSRTLFRPLAELIGAADDIGRGDYDRRFQVPAATELATLAGALGRIAREAKRQLAAIGAERDHLRATVAGMAEGVLVADRQGRPRLVNPAFRELFDLDRAAPVEALLELAREPRLGDLLARVLATGAAPPVQIERLEPSRRTLALQATALAGELGAVVVARDVTASERLHEMRKDFVANVSHELRSPLTAIQGYAETLCDGAIEERETALRFSARILDQCRRLGDLLDDLLTLSRLEATERGRTTAPVDLLATIEEAVEMARGAAAARQVTIAVEPPGGAPVVEGDADGLLRMVSNLLDNAVKYNRAEGAVTVRLAVAAGEAVLEVADSGIGIPAAALPRIFERFFRVDKGRARDEGGTGLGLAIVKHVAQAHGGRVEVASEPGRGSTFRVFLPLSAEGAPARPAG